MGFNSAFKGLTHCFMQLCLTAARITRKTSGNLCSVIRKKLRESRDVSSTLRPCYCPGRRKATETRRKGISRTNSVQNIHVHYCFSQDVQLAFGTFRSGLYGEHVTYNQIHSVGIPTRCSFVIEFIIPKFIKGSACFELHTAHHQEL